MSKCRLLVLLIPDYFSIVFSVCMNGKSIFLRPKNLWVTLDSLFSTLISNPIANYLGSPPETSRGWPLLTPLIPPSYKLLSSLACFIAKLRDSCWSLNATACSFSFPYFSAIVPIVYLYMAVRAVLLKQIRSCQSYVGDAFFSFSFFTYFFFSFHFFLLRMSLYYDLQCLT